MERKLKKYAGDWGLRVEKGKETAVGMVPSLFPYEVLSLEFQHPREYCEAKRQLQSYRKYENNLFFDKKYMITACVLIISNFMDKFTTRNCGKLTDTLDLTKNSSVDNSNHG